MKGIIRVIPIEVPITMETGNETVKRSDLLELYCNVFRDEFELPEEIIDIIENDMEARLDLD